MIPDEPELSGLASRIAVLLNGGTVLSCALIAAGTALTLLVSTLAGCGQVLVSTGVVLLLLLPPLRVLVAATYFMRRRDYFFALVALLVLSIIVASTSLGLESP